MNIKEKTLEVMRKSAFNDNLGVESIEIKEGKSIVIAKVAKHNLNPFGKLQGGVVYAICDMTAYAAFLSAADEGAFGISNHLSIQMLRTADLGDQMTFQGEVRKLGKKQCFINVEVFVANKLLATASITKTII